MILLSSHVAKITGIVIYILFYILLLQQSDLVFPKSIVDYLGDFWKYRWTYVWIGIKAALVFGLFLLLAVYIPIHSGKPFIVITK